MTTIFIQYFNQHSFVLSSLVLFAVVAAGLLRDGLSRRDALALVALGGGLALAFFLLRIGPSDLRRVDAVEATLANGTRPTLVEFYSNY